MNEKIKTVRYTIKGRVHNVGFRYFVLRNAEKLNIKGEVKNLSKGVVMVIAQGNKQTLAQLELMLFKGPSFAKVLDLQSSIINTDKIYSHFSIIR